MPYTYLEGHLYTINNLSQKAIYDMTTQISRCEPDDPHRCQAGEAKGGQCMNLAMRDGDKWAKNCSFHGGVDDLQRQRETSKNMYRLAKFGQRVGEFSNHSAVKGLRDEIGILRMILEERLNRCQDNDELLLQSNVISDLVTKIERVVTSCHKLEASMGQMLDKNQIIQFAEAMINVVASEIQDPDALSRIAAKVGAATEAQLSGVERQHAEKKESAPMRASLD